MIQILQKILFTAILSLCASFTAFAQSNDNRQPPPKVKPPVVVVPPQKDKPKDEKKDDDKKPGKPQSYSLNTMQSVNIFD